MKEQTDLNSILKAGKLNNELDFERALIIDRKLRLIAKENPELLESRKKLRLIIKQFEKSNWSRESEIDDFKIKESDIAEFIAEQERIFLENRKNIIKKRLSQLNLSQQELGKILGHGKSYMSELINGISPFSMKDLIIINRLFGIKLDSLIPIIISQNDRRRIKLILAELDNQDLKLEKEDLICA
jgi:transcriptional regulator with XRE-family HTH domain